MKIILTGFMGSGKTTVGQMLARRLSLPFVEMDQEILVRAGFSDMGQLFAQKGEIYLREWEIRLASELSKKKNCVISTGGGVVMNKIIIDYLKMGEGKVVFLQAPFDILYDHVKKDGVSRPLFENKKDAKKLFDFRATLYLRYADIIVDIQNKTISSVVDELISNLS